MDPKYFNQDSVYKSVRRKEITICIAHKKHFTSQGVGGNISRSDFGNMVEACQRRRARRFCCIGRMG